MLMWPSNAVGFFAIHHGPCFTGRLEHGFSGADYRK
jgi:hypothetical protein